MDDGDDGKIEPEQSVDSSFNQNAFHGLGLDRIGLLFFFLDLMDFLDFLDFVCKMHDCSRRTQSLICTAGKSWYPKPWL